MNTGLRLFGAILCSVQLLSAQGTQAAVPATAEDFFRLIRANDLDAVRQLAAKSGAASVRTSLGETPLHYAATYGSTESVRILLDRGADPNARNSAEATPLIYAGYSLEKTRLLVEKGAGLGSGISDAAYEQVGARIVEKHFTLDKHNAATREYLASKADFVGAIRLPSVAFKREGTAVVTDIVFLRRRSPGEPSHHVDADWLGVVPLAIDGMRP